MTVTATGLRPVRSRRAVVAALVLLLGLPVVMVPIEAVRYRVQNRTNGAIVSSGVRREYRLFVPSSYDRTTPVPLVISLHGGAMWPVAQQETSQWNRVAEAHGFMVVYPSGTEGDGPKHWNSTDATGFGSDVKFIADLIDTLQATWNIDSTRIYADGLSNGGGMAFVLSCTLYDRIAAVGLVGAAHFLPMNWCGDRRPMPMVSFHGTADRATPYRGGKSWVASARFPSIPAWTASWAQRNRCDAKPTESVVTADVRRTEYTGCANDASVVLYTVEDGGHSWPGGKPVPDWLGGRTATSVSASSEMWAFFRAHRVGAGAAAASPY